MAVRRQATGDVRGAILGYIEATYPPSRDSQERSFSGGRVKYPGTQIAQQWHVISGNIAH